MNYYEFECANEFCKTLRTILYLSIKGKIKCFVKDGTLYIDIENGSTLFRCNQNNIYELITLGLTASSEAIEVINEYRKYIRKKIFFLKSVDISIIMWYYNNVLDKRYKSIS